MKHFFAFLVLFLGIQSAQATSLHPCTPRIQAQPTTMYCKDGDVYFSIRIDTLMSDVRNDMCTGKNFYEYHSAVVKVSDRNGKDPQTLKFDNADFTYTLFGPQGATFKANDGSLNLDHCAVPQNGGFSVGN